MRKSAIILAAIAAPFAAFALLYSIDYGCFICLYGEDRGSGTEKVINITLLSGVVLLLLYLAIRSLTRGK